MKFDKLKPNLQELNLNGVKKAASRVAHVRIRLSRGQWIGVIAGLVVVTVLLVILLRPRPAAVVLPVVAVEPVTTEDVNIYGDYVGRIRAQQFVEIRARVEGYLEKMLFAEGTYIRKGQTLFVIDPRVYRARVDKAKAQLNKARAQALKAKRDLDRIRPLFEQSAASQLELDNATAAYESAVADVAVGEADLTQAQMTLGYTSVQSPIAGYISERNADIGTLVGPSGKSLLATVVKSDTVRVDFSMTALDYLRSKARNVNLGHRDSTRKWDPYITVTLADGSEYPYRGLSISLTRRSIRRRVPSPCEPRWPTLTTSCCRGSSPRCGCCSTCVRMPSSCRRRLSRSRRAVPTSTWCAPTASSRSVLSRRVPNGATTSSSNAAWCGARISSSRATINSSTA